MPRIKTLSGEVKAGATPPSGDGRALRHVGRAAGVVMLVAKHFDEPTIYKAAFAYEQAGDWKKM